MVFIAWLSDRLTDIACVRPIRRVVNCTYGLTKIGRYSIHPGVSDKFLMQFIKSFSDQFPKLDSDTSYVAYHNLLFASQRRALPLLTLMKKEEAGIRGNCNVLPTMKVEDVHDVAMGYYVEASYEHIDILYLAINYYLLDTIRYYISSSAMWLTGKVFRKNMEISDELLIRLCVADMNKRDLYVDSWVSRVYRVLRAIVPEFQDSDAENSDEDSDGVTDITMSNITHSLALEMCFK